jgi:hypothetical protein
VVISLVLCTVVAWRAGLVFTTVGRRVILFGILGGIAMAFAFPAALEGVMERFQYDDTADRFKTTLEVLPPVSMSTYDYPFFGVGTGMQQNYRGQFGLGDSEIGWVESESGKYLVELGAIGYLLVWLSKFGLVMLLWRASNILKRAGRRPAAGAAVAYALLTFYGPLTFDHNYAALYFLGLGFILQEVVRAWPRASAGEPAKKTPLPVVSRDPAAVH